MNINDINKKFTKLYHTRNDELDRLGEKIFRERILPKVEKAVNKVESNICVHFFFQKHYDATIRVLGKHGLICRELLGPPFFAGSLRIGGWKLVNLDPNEILKEMI